MKTIRSSRRQRAPRNEPRLSLQNHRKIPSRTHLQRLSRKGPWSTRLYLGAAMQAISLSLLFALWWLHMMALEVVKFAIGTHR